MITVRAHHLSAPGYIRANTFGLPFGLCGLALCWSASSTVARVPRWPSDALWILAALTWLATGLAYLLNVLLNKRVLAEIDDQTFGPFIALAFIVLMMLGSALAARLPSVGKTCFFLGLALTVAFGAYQAGGWLRPGDRLGRIRDAGLRKPCQADVRLRDALLVDLRNGRPGSALRRS
jgi:tellurite resistance protein